LTDDETDLFDGHGDVPDREYHASVHSGSPEMYRTGIFNPDQDSDRTMFPIGKESLSLVPLCALPVSKIQRRQGAFS
jgi:hypothetical protein